MAQAIGFNEGLLKRIDENREKQTAQDRDFMEFRVFKQFYDRQRELLYDREQRKLVCTGRRWGKTEVAAGKFVLTALEGQPMYYIHLNVTNAINQMWAKVVKYAESMGFPVKKEDRANHEIQWPNGAVLRFRGNNTSAEADKLRGDPARLAIIDEAGAQRWLRYLVDDVLSPMFADYGDKGELIIQGTPPKIPKTFFEEVLWKSAGYKKYSGNFFENPHIPDPQGFLDTLCEDRGITMDDPFIQREFMGVMGAYDTDALIYKNRTYHKELPKYPITDIAIGIDYGFKDFNAIIGLAYDRKSRKGFVFFEEKFNKTGAEFICEVAKTAYEKAKKLASERGMDTRRIILVADTSDQSISYDMATKYRLPVQNAYKYHKEYAIELLAAALNKDITIPKNGPLDEELGSLIWTRDEEGRIIHMIDDVFGEHPDAADALLYAFRDYRVKCGYKTEDEGPQDIQYRSEVY